MTQYEKRKQGIKDFIKMLDGRVTHALNQRDENGNEEFLDNLHEEKFELYFMGKSCEILFGSTEYFAITKALEDIYNDM